MVVAVTGADGFVGAALCEYLRAHGVEVRPLARKDYSDLAQPIDWKPLITGVDCIIHTAARAHVGHQHTPALVEEYRRINAEATKALATQAAEAGAKRFIFLSTAQVHGRSSPAPLIESSPLNGQTPYALSKILAEEYLQEIAVSTGLQVITLRPPLVYGAGVKANFRALLKLAATRWPLPFANLTAKRSYIYIDNLCHAVLTCIHADTEISGAYLIADTGAASVAELVGMMRVGRTKKLFPFSPSLLTFLLALTGKSQLTETLLKPMILDTSAFQRDFAWTPPMTLAEGVAATTHWYKEQRQCPI